MKKNVPKIRFKGCQGEWERKKAKDIFTTFEERKRPDLPVLAAFQDIRGMVVRSESGYDISHDHSNEITYKHVLPGQFVIHLRSFQGGFAHSSVEGITSPAYTVFGFKDADKHDDYYWKYIFMSKTFINRLKLITYGIRDGRSISFTDFADFEFVIPSLPEQHQIAAYFRSLDGILSGCEARLSSLRRLKEGALQAFFPQQGETGPKIRFKGCKGEWERKRLGEVLTYEQPGNYIVSSADYINEGTPVLTAGQTFILGYTDETKGIYKANKTNPVIIFDDFTTSFHWVDFDFKIKSSAMKMLKARSEEVCFRYLYYAMKCIRYVPAEHARQWIGLYSHFSIPIPPLPEQRLIADFFRALDHRIDLERQRLEKLKLLKAACLEKMFV